jgi:hypothetical protein
VDWKNVFSLSLGPARSTAPDKTKKKK